MTVSSSSESKTEKRCEICKNASVIGYDVKEKANLFECTKLFSEQGNEITVKANDYCAMHFKRREG